MEEEFLNQRVSYIVSIYDCDITNIIKVKFIGKKIFWYRKPFLLIIKAKDFLEVHLSILISLKYSMQEDNVEKV
jgi:hypothetical protein